MTKLRNIWQLAVFGLLMVVQLAAPASAQDGEENICSSRGYVLGFFNGVWNTPTADSAYAGLGSLRALVGREFNGEPIRPELFYNHTGSTVDATFMQDIAEVFIQRAQEIDESGELERRFEYLWEVLTDGNLGFLERLRAAFPAADSAIEQLYEDIANRAAAGYSLLLSDPPTLADRAEHRSRLQEFELQGQKFLLIAHSQGNLFVNRAHDFLSTIADADSFATVHIAPASPTLRGGYLLSGNDLIINALRLQGLTSVPASNITIPFRRADVSGHTLVDTYLDASRNGRARVQSLAQTALEGLMTPESDAAMGFFTITLTWDGSGDVDLHTFEPNGTQVFYQDRSGDSGFLDVDNVVADGPEHYFATCDREELQLGTYRIAINNFSEATGRIATVQAASARDGVLATRTLGVGPERGSDGDDNPRPVFEVVLSEDAEGEIQASVTQ